MKVLLAWGFLRRPGCEIWIYFRMSRYYLVGTMCFDAFNEEWTREQKKSTKCRTLKHFVDLHTFSQCCFQSWRVIWFAFLSVQNKGMFTLGDCNTRAVCLSVATVHYQDMHAQGSSKGCSTMMFTHKANGGVTNTGSKANTTVYMHMDVENWYQLTFQRHPRPSTSWSFVDGPRTLYLNNFDWEIILCICPQNVEQASYTN